MVFIGLETVMSSMQVSCWFGTCREVILFYLKVSNLDTSGYAADGYARVNGIAALVTTFGVGELSALNAIAGAYSEFVPIVHIVGQPHTRSQKDGVLLHHTLGNGDFNVFSRMSADISCSVAHLSDTHEWRLLLTLPSENAGSAAGQFTSHSPLT